MLTHQYPCERYPTDEGLTVVTSGIGTVSLVDASLTGLGTKCVQMDGSNTSSVAYMRADRALAAGQWFAMSLYFRTHSASNGWYIEIRPTSGRFWHFDIYSNSFRSLVYDDSNSLVSQVYGQHAATPEIIHRIAIAFLRATSPTANDGQLIVKFDGNSWVTQTGRDFDSCISTFTVWLGSNATAGVPNWDVDDIRFGTRLDDVLPGGVTPPTPDGELPQPKRTVVLFNQNNADSRTFAESIAADEGLLCPLPCSTTETLANYQAFYDQVEFPLKNFLAFQPAVDAQATCIIAGHMVPGYFTNDANLINVCSRLMDIDSTFVAGKANPLYATSDRLTATAVQAAGVRLAARIDGTTLADCQLLQSLGDEAVEVEEGASIFTSDAPTLDQQLLRLPIKVLEADDVVSGDAMYYYRTVATGTTSSSAVAGSRLASIFNNSTDITRGEIAYATGDWHYRSLILYSNTFDFSAFCRMLLAGGTLAEAFAVASQYLNIKNQLAGYPFMTATFPVSGYNVYADGVLIAATPAGVGTVDIQHPAGQEIDYTVTAVSEYGVESTATDPRTVEADGTAGRPNEVTAAAAEVVADGYIRVIGVYYPQLQAAVAASVAVARVSDGAADWENPLATVGVTATAQSNIDVPVGPFTTGQRVLLAVRAETAAGIGGPETLLPEVFADATPPAPVDLLVAETSS